MNMLQHSNRIKTHSHNRMHVDQFYMGNSQEIGVVVPLLQNRRIKFNHRSQHPPRKVLAQIKENKPIKGVSNIEKLKKEIMELEKDDFASYRRKMEDHSQNSRKINQQNVLLSDLNKEMTRLKRPKTTLGVFEAFTTTPLSSFSSAPHKYYSKKKNRCDTTLICPQKDSIQVNCQRISPPSVEKVSRDDGHVFAFMNKMLKGRKKKKIVSLDKQQNFSAQI